MTTYYAAWLPTYNDPEPQPLIGPRPSLWPATSAEEARERVWRWLEDALPELDPMDIHVKPWEVER